MTISRPLPVALIKKMFLKVLHEHHRPGGRYSRHGWDYTGILRETISGFYSIHPLSDQEYRDGLRAVFELERDGFIMQDASQSSDVFKELTTKGKKVVEQSLDDMRLTLVDIDQLLTHVDLRQRVRDDYLGGDYDTSILKGFELLEETVRAKACLPPEAIGTDLMTRAFRPDGGILRQPTARTGPEIEAFHQLMRGSIMWFKNSNSHRTLSYNDPIEAANVLGIANLLLQMVDKC